jgi:hypothetical protein
VREQQFGDAVRLFQVWITGEDEGVDAQVGVFLDARGHGRAIAHQRGAGTAAHQADAGPQVGADFQVVATAAVQRSHALLAHRIEARQGSLGAGDGVVVQVRDQAVGGLPGFGVGFAHDHMQANAEAHGRALSAALARTCSIFSATAAGGSPQVRYQLDLLGRQVLRRFGGAAEIQRRTRLLDRRIEQLGALHLMCSPS